MLIQITKVLGHRHLKFGTDYANLVLMAENFDYSDRRSMVFKMDRLISTGLFFSVQDASFYSMCILCQNKNYGKQTDIYMNFNLFYTRSFIYLNIAYLYLK